MHKRPSHPDARPADRARARPAFPFLPILAALLAIAVQPSIGQTALSVPPYELLVSPSSTPDQRLAAATEILQTSHPAGGLTDALPLLSGDPTGGEAARSILLALARLAQAPPSALAPTLAIARDDASPLQLDAIRALRAFRTRDAAAALVELTTESHTPAVREGAFRSLARLSGRDDLGTDAGAWRDWLARILGVSERQWEQELLACHIRQSQRLETVVVDGDRRLIEAWRQIHLLTPPEGRSAVLVRLLESDLASLRDLGFELVNREIGESRVLESSVAEAAIRLLESPDPLVRAQAALVLNRLVPADAETPVLAALAREADPRGADALLLAASRWPSPAAVRPMLRWMAGPPTLALRASGLAWALLRAGYLERAEDRAAVLAALRTLQPPTWTSPACRLLVSLGDEQDIAAVRALLLDPAVEPAQRAVAADALGLRDDQVNALLAAAMNDPAVFEATARAVRTHLHDARGFAALAQLPAPSAQVRSRVLADYATALSTAELVRLAKLATGPGEVIPLLNPLISAERLAASPAPPELAEGLLLLARAQLEMSNPADALNALSLIPEGQAPASASELADLRVTLLLWLNRVEEAEELDASANAWLDALELAVTEPHAAVIAARLEDRFGEDLTAEQRAQLERLRREVADADAEASPEDGG